MYLKKNTNKNKTKKKRETPKSTTFVEKKRFHFIFILTFFFFNEELTLCWKSYLGFTTIDRLAHSFAFRDY